MLLNKGEVGGKCGIECMIDSDCKSSETCENNICEVSIEPPTPPTPTIEGFFANLWSWIKSFFGMD